jgi:hypothetical protein
MITACLKKSGSPWHIKGDWGLEIEAVIPIKPVPMKGSLGFWNCKFEYEPYERT